MEPGWTTRLLDEGGDDTEMAFSFDAQGVGHYAFAKGSWLYVGTTKPGDTPHLVDDASGSQHVHMVRDSRGSHHVLFARNEGVYYAHDETGSWETHSLGAGRPSGLAFDAGGVLHVLMQQTLPQLGTIYVHGTHPGTTSWLPRNLTELGRAGNQEQLVVDASNHLHILFLRRTFSGSTHVYATDATGAWTVEPPDWAMPVESERPRVQLQVDARGRAHVVGSDASGTWWWAKDGDSWQRHFLGPFQSHGPALRMGDDGPSHVLLDDSDEVRPGRMAVWALTPGVDGGSITPWLPVEPSHDGGTFPVGTALHVDDGGVVRVGYPYVAYTDVDGGAPKVKRGLRYARYCP